jgi:hypothetical protein
MIVMVLGAFGQVLDLRLVEGLFALVLFHLAEDGVLLERLWTVLVGKGHMELFRAGGRRTSTSFSFSESILIWGAF